MTSPNHFLRTSIPGRVARPDATGVVLNEKLPQVTWTDRRPSDDSIWWRQNIEDSMSRVLFHLADGNPANQEAWIAYPDLLDEQVLVSGLMRPKWKMGGTTARTDHEDVARWLGGALALVHQHMDLARDNKMRSGRFLYGVLEQLMKESTAVAWIGQTLPEWAEHKLGGPQGVSRGVANFERHLYRPWSETQGTLLVLLDAFHQNTKGTVLAPWANDHAARGCLALRLLAGTAPNQVTPELVDQLDWLEPQMCSDITPDRDSELLRQLVRASWDRAVLERVTQDRASDEKNEKPKRGGPRIM